MCVRNGVPKIPKGEADISLLLFYWQLPDDMLFYLTEKCARHLEEKLLP